MIETRSLELEAREAACSVDKKGFCDTCETDLLEQRLLCARFLFRGSFTEVLDGHNFRFETTRESERHFPGGGHLFDSEGNLDCWEIPRLVPKPVSCLLVVKEVLLQAKVEARLDSVVILLRTEVKGGVS